MRHDHSAGDTMSRIVVTALPAPSQVSIEQAWLHPVLPPRLSITKGDIKLVRIMVSARLARCDD